MEVAAAAEQGSSTGSRRRKKRTTADESQEEEAWMLDLRSTMKANQALLERLLEERSQPQTRREAFIRYVSDTLRTVSDEEYSEMHDLISDMMRRRKAQSTSGAEPRSSTSAPQASTSTSQPAFTPTYSQQQYYLVPGFESPSPSKWQYGVVGGHQQAQQPAPARARDSAESVGRILASSIAEDWSLTLTPAPPSSKHDDDTRPAP